MNCKDLVLDNVKFFGIVYGGIGAGKTWLLRTLPRPCYVFSTDAQGLTTNRGEDIDGDYYFDDVSNGVIIDTAWNKIINKLVEFEKNPVYASYAFDSATTLQESGMRQILKESKKRSPEIQHWRDIADRFIDLFVRLGRLNAHVVLTAHESMEKDDVAGTVKICPHFNGKILPLRCGAYFSEVYRLDVRRNPSGKLERVLYTEKGENFDAKSRLGCLNPTEPPDITAILKKAGVVK